MSRGIGLGVFAAFVAAACGGTVRDDRPPSEVLRTDAPARCHTACQTVVKCGLDSDCDCSCTCPPNASDCECGPCVCPRTKQDTCEKDCAEAVSKALDGAPPCDGEMLALLDCLAATSCVVKTDNACKTEQGALAGCQRQAHSSPPPAIDSSDPAPRPPVTVTCSNEIVSGTAPSDGSSVPPGAPFCKQEWQSCSDGHSYGVECTVTPATDLACTCIRDGLPEVTFITPACPGSTSDVNAQCNWHLS